MTSRWLPVPAALALLAGCAEPAAENRQDAPKSPPTAAAAPAPASVPAANQQAEPPDEAADLSSLSPSRRRAYERGLADCRAGRYAPENYPEAYRIGCAAAQDR